jgi:hypothetical protein
MHSILGQGLPVLTFILKLLPLCGEGCAFAESEPKVHTGIGAITCDETNIQVTSKALSKAPV